MFKGVFMVKAILGPMYSGKSTELFRYAERAVRAKKDVLLIRPNIDNRGYFSHSSGTEVLFNNISIPVIYESDLSNYDIRQFNDIDMLFIDEFFMIKGVNLLLERLKRSCNIEIYLAGLISTSENVTFEQVSLCLPYCDDIIKLNAVCSVCGSDLGNHTFYKAGVKDSSQSIVVGGDQEYDARCYQCYCVGEHQKSS